MVYPNRKNIMGRVSLLFPILLLISIFSSCNNGDNKIYTKTDLYNWLPKKILFSQIGQKTNVRLFNNYDNPITDFSLTSENPNIADIKDKEIISKNFGKTFVILKYGNFSKKITVDVNPAISFKKIFIDRKEINIKNFGLYSLTITGIDSERNIYYGIQADWKTSDNLIAEVENNGYVEIKIKNGSTKVTAEVNGKSDICTINVNIEKRQPYGYKLTKYRIGENGGFGEEFLPENILGAPKGGNTVQSSEKELFSLGNGGDIIIETGNYIIDKPGYDFIIFENPICENRDCSVVFTESAIVGVSQNGKDFLYFPDDYFPETTGAGEPYNNPADFYDFAGINPVYADPPTISATDPSVSGGDKFNLSELGIKWARYVKIIDTGFNKKDINGDLIDDAGNHFSCEPNKCGFDLDAVSVIHSGHKVP